MTSKILCSQNDQFDGVPSVIFIVLKTFPSRVGTTKIYHNGLPKRTRRRGLCLQSQDGQDLCVFAAAEELIFNTSEGFSERFSPWLYSGWRTRGPPRWHTATSGYVKMQTCDHTCAGWGTWLSCKNDVFTHILHGMYELCSTHMKDTNRNRQNRCFCFLAVSTQLHFRALWRT